MTPEQAWRAWLATYQQARLIPTDGLVWFATHTAFLAGYAAALRQRQPKNSSHTAP